MKTEETALIERLKNSDVRAYTQIYDLYHERLYAFILRFVKIPELAEDILQEVFLTLWRVRAKIDSSQSFQAYLYKISRNCVFKTLKKTARQQFFLERIQLVSCLQTGPGEDQLRWKEYENILLKAIEHLPPQRKKVFQMCREDGKSYDRVAEELGISKNTVKEHMILATKTIKLYLNQYIDFQLLVLLILLSII
ncbi:RNA polymerase sigma factor [Niabella aquatica]